MIRITNIYDKNIYKCELLTLKRLNIYLGLSKSDNIITNYINRDCEVEKHSVLIRKCIDDNYFKEVMTGIRIPVLKTTIVDKDTHFSRINSLSFIDLKEIHKNIDDDLYIVQNLMEASRKDIIKYWELHPDKAKYYEEIKSYFYESEYEYNKSLQKAKSIRNF